VLILKAGHAGSGRVKKWQRII